MKALTVSQLNDGGILRFKEQKDSLVC